MARSDTYYERQDAKRGAAAAVRAKREEAQRSTGPADWGSARPDLLAAVIAAVTASGEAIRFGYTRDGGAYSVGFYPEGAPFTEYIRPNEDINEFLEGVYREYSKT